MRSETTPLENGTGLKEGGFRRVEIPHALIGDIAGSLRQHVIGQDEAVDAVAKAILRARARVIESKQPLSAFMFLGRTGVGKTEMAIAMAKVQFGDKWADHYRRIDCSSLRQPHDTAKIQGAPPGYVGYGDPLLITPEFLDQEGGVVLVFDEFEKAHPEVQKLLLPILQEGELVTQASTGKQSNSGHQNKEIAPRTLKFDNAFIVLTSNIGAEAIDRAGMPQLGFKTPTSSTNPDMREMVMREVRAYYTGIPELMGRVGEPNIIVFKDLGQQAYSEIFDKTIARINGNQREIRTPISITPELKEWLIQKAVGDGRYGARDIEHVIETHILTKVAEARTSGLLRDGSALVLRVNENKEVELWTKDAETASDPDRNSLINAIGARVLPSSVAATGHSDGPVPVRSTENNLGNMQRNIPFNIYPAFKAERGREGVRRINVEVDGIGKGFIEIAEFEPRTKNNSIVVFASPENRLYTLSVNMQSKNPSRVAKCTITLPTVRYYGVGTHTLSNGVWNNVFIGWMNQRTGVVSFPLVFSENDLRLLEVTINSKKAAHRY